MTGAFELETVVHHRDPKRFVRNASFVLVVLAVAATAIYLMASAPADSVAHKLALKLIGMLAGFAFFALGMLFAIRENELAAKPGSVRGDGVYVGERRILRFGAHEDAFYERRGDAGGVVRFVGPAGRTVCDVAVQSDEQATWLLHRAAKVDQRRFWIPGWRRPSPAILAMVMFFLFNTVGDSLGPYFFAIGLFVPLVLVLARRRRLEIDAGSLIIGGIIGKTKIPLANVRSIEPLAVDTARVAFEGGTRDVLVGTEMGLSREALAPRRDVVIDYVRAAFDRNLAREHVRQMAEPLERGERTVEAWLRDLAAMRASAYRNAPLRDDDLWRILEEPTVPEDARAAAALLLRQNATPATAERIRIAVEGDDFPRLRIALEQALESDDDLGNHEAFAALAPPPARRAK